MKITNSVINNVNVMFIQTNKFKTITFKLFFGGQFNKETATSRSLLARVLSNSTAKYPSKQDMAKKIYSLYSAAFGIHATSRYESSILSFTLDVVNGKYVNDENVLDESLNFLKEVIFNPNLNKEAFSNKVFREEKRLLKASIDNIYNNKHRYALRQLLSKMCADEVSSISTLGSLEELEKITPKSLYTTYTQMINEDNLDLYIIGDFDIHEMSEKISKIITFKERDYKEFSLYSTEEKRNIAVNEIHEHQDINQTRLLLGFRTNTSPVSELSDSLTLFNIMFGGLFNSNLFKVVREEHSLAYQIASEVATDAGLLIVSAGIDNKNINVASSLIINELRKYQDGQINSELLAAAKVNIINLYKELSDNADILLSYIHTQRLLGLDYNLEKQMKVFTEIEVEDIKQVADNIELDTIYSLSNKQGEEDE